MTLGGGAAQAFTLFLFMGQSVFTCDPCEFVIGHRASDTRCFALMANFVPSQSAWWGESTWMLHAVHSHGVLLVVVVLLLLVRSCCCCWSVSQSGFYWCSLSCGVGPVLVVLLLMLLLLLSLLLALLLLLELLLLMLLLLLLLLL